MVNRHRKTMMRRLLVELADCPGTAEQLAEWAGFTPADGAWKRVSDLKNEGLAEGTGKTLLGSQGRPQEVLRITQRGMDWL